MRMNSKSPFQKHEKAYRIKNKAADEATVYIYDEIGWFGVLAEDFIKDFADIKAPTIHMRMNSPGGNVFDGAAIYNAIKQHKSKVVTHIDGLAASISSVIALAGDEVRMAENSFFMIHEPWSLVLGDAEGLRKEADLLDKIGGMILNTYKTKTDKEDDEIRAWMKDETWFSAKEALDAGFADAIEEEEEIEEDDVSAKLFDLSIFNNVPSELKNKRQMPSKRDLESILRDAGCSKSEAKAILAEGYPGGEPGRDAQDNLTEPPKPTLRDVEPVKVKAKEKKRDKIADLIIRAKRAASGSQATLH